MMINKKGWTVGVESEFLNRVIKLILKSEL